MKNFKIILTTVIIDYIYCLLSFFFFFVVAEYIYDLFANLARFKLMHSLVDNIYFILILLVWVFLTVAIVKFNKKTFKILNINKIILTAKNKKYLVIASCLVALLIVGWSVVSNLNTKPPQLYLSSEFSKTVQAIVGSYSWTNGRESVMADSVHPTEFKYTSDNTLITGRDEQMILSNKKTKFNRRYPFELLTLECFDKNNVVVDYKIAPAYINDDIYINAPLVNGSYICNAILKYKEGVVSYGYKIVVVDDIIKINALYANKTDYLGDNNKVSAIIRNLTIPTQLNWNGMELQTKKEPYGLTMNYSISSEDLRQIDWKNLKNIFQKNAIVIFSLIDNVENIAINLKQDESIMTSNYSRKMADEYMKQDVRQLAESKESFKFFLSQLYTDFK